MRHVITALLIFGGVFVFSSGCSAAPNIGPTSRSVEVIGTPSVAPSAPEPVATVPATRAPATSASPAIPFPKAGGLEKLDSYTVVLQSRFQGTQDGRRVDATDLYTRTFTLNPPAQFTTVQTTEDGNPTTAIHGLVGDVLYTRLGSDAPCTAAKSDAKDLRGVDPARMLKSISNGRDQGIETVNGAAARHYVGDPVSNATTRISGEVWIAEPGGYVVKYTLQVKGGEGYFGKGSSGEQTLSYDLRDIAAKKAVAVPAGCPPPVVDLPAMPDAANVTRSLTQLNYTTASGLSKTVAFYQERMKALGWTVESSTGPRDASAVQAPGGVPGMPGNIPGMPTGMPNLPQVPGIDLSKFMPTAVPVPTGVSSGPPGDSWLVFALAKEQRRAFITMRPEGAVLRVVVQVEQMR